jgi:type I restriction enzyme S subunit
LPPLEEQRRIVARIDELAAKIEEARRLRQEGLQAAKGIRSRVISDILSNERWEFRKLEQILAEPPRNGLAPQQEIEIGGLPMLRINAVSSSPTRFVDLTAFKLVGVAKEIAEPFFLRHDDVFIVRYNGDINRVAKAAIFKSSSNQPVIYPDKLMRLRPDVNKVLPDFLVYALGCRSVRSQIEGMGKTTAGQIGVSGKDAKSFQVPVPPLSEQRRIVTYLDELQTALLHK